MDEHSYTANLKDCMIYINDEEEDDETEQKVLAFLKNAETFRHFGEGLSWLIRQKADEEVDPAKYLQKCARKNAEEFNRGTIKQWFTTGNLKRGRETREKMYKIAFVLELSIEETEYLFRNIYLDRPFAVRDPEEFIYVFCFQNGYRYADAKKFVEKWNAIKTEGEDEARGVGTNTLYQELDKIQTEEDLFHYLRIYEQDFRKSQASAYAVAEQLTNRIRIRKEEKTSKEALDQMSELMKQYQEKEDWYKEKHYDISSISSMLRLILGVDLVPKKGRQTSILDGANRLPKEIITAFPTKHTYSNIKKKDANPEELRKMIILLASYLEWRRLDEKEWNGEGTTRPQSEYEEYVNKVNAILTQAGFERQLLYYGNPYDWLFMYCSIQTDSFETFRRIMSEAIIKLQEEA